MREWWALGADRRDDDRAGCATRATRSRSRSTARLRAGWASTRSSSRTTCTPGWTSSSRPALQGAGLGSGRRCGYVARWLIDERGHHRLTIDPAPPTSARSAPTRRSAFGRVGIMRRYERGADGEWHDGLLMDLLAEELEVRASTADPHAPEPVLTTLTVELNRATLARQMLLERASVGTCRGGRAPGRDAGAGAQASRSSGCGRGSRASPRRPSPRRAAARATVVRATLMRSTLHLMSAARLRGAADGAAAAACRSRCACSARGRRGSTPSGAAGGAQAAGRPAADVRRDPRAVAGAVSPTSTTARWATRCARSCRSSWCPAEHGALGLSARRELRARRGVARRRRWRRRRSGGARRALPRRVRPGERRGRPGVVGRRRHEGRARRDARRARGVRRRARPRAVRPARRAATAAPTSPRRRASCRSSTTSCSPTTTARASSPTSTARS